MSQTDHAESFGWDAVEAYLESKGAKFVRQSGSHRHFALPNGKIVGSGIHGDVPCSLMRRNATVLGLTYNEMRTDMGRPVNRSGRSRHKPDRAPTSGGRATKAQVLGRLSEANDLLYHLDRMLRNGTRDASVYEDVFGELATALRALNTASKRAGVTS